jgi:hypothetical protein
MKFNRSAVSAAMLMAICLAVPVIANAAVGAGTSAVGRAAPQPSLSIETLCGQGNHLFNIRNNGATASGFCSYKISTSAGRVWQLMLFPLAPRSVFNVTMPSAAWGLEVTLEVDSGTQVIAVSSSTPYPNFRCSE